MSKRSVDPLYQPFIQPTSENHSPWVIVSTCLFMIITVSVTATTLIARFRVLRTLAWSDWFLLFAAVCILPSGYPVTIFLLLSRRRTYTDGKVFVNR